MTRSRVVPPLLRTLSNDEVMPLPIDPMSRRALSCRTSPDPGARLSADANDPVRNVDFDAYFGHTSVPTLLIDHQRRQIIRVNDAALAFLGLDAAQILGRPGTDFMTRPSQERLAQIRDFRGDETALLMDVPTTLGVRTVELNILPAGVDGVAFVELLNVTDALDAATQANARADELARASTALRTIAGRLAHDLRGPMTSISGFANLLLDPDANLTDTERTNVLERIAANTNALAAMANSILGEADTGATRPEDDSHATEDLFRVVRAVTEAQLSECGGHLETTTEVASLPVDVGSIRQAVINLVSNSIKYRAPERPLRIDITIRDGPTGPDIVVRDNGKGLAEPSAELFEAGTRGAAAQGTTGAGLGLAFVRAAVERVGGSVTGTGLSPGAEFVIHLATTPELAEIAPDPGEAGSALTAPQLALVIDWSPVPTFVVDIALRQIVCVNRASVALLGVEATDILGRPGSDFIDEQAIAEALRRRVLDDPDASTALHTNLRAPGGDVAVSIWISAVEGTALAVAQAVPTLDTLQHG